MLQVQQMFIAVTSLHTCMTFAFPHIVEAVYNVNVAEGDSMTLMHKISGVTEEYTIVWFIQDANADDRYCDISASPTRVVQPDEIEICHETFSRFQGCIIEHTNSTDEGDAPIEHYLLTITYVQFSDTKFKIGSIYKTESTRSILQMEWVSISVHSRPFLPTATTTESFTSQTADTEVTDTVTIRVTTSGPVIGGSSTSHSNQTAAGIRKVSNKLPVRVTASGPVVGGSVAACLILLLIIIAILLILIIKRRQSENNNQSQSKNLNETKLTSLQVYHSTRMIILRSLRYTLFQIRKRLLSTRHQHMLY